MSAERETVTLSVSETNDGSFRSSWFWTNRHVVYTSNNHKTREQAIGCARGWLWRHRKQLREAGADAVAAATEVVK